MNPPEAMRKAQSLSAKIQQFRSVAQQVKDADVKAKLQQEAAEIETEQATLYREVVEKHADAPAAVQAAQSLLRTAGPLKLDAAEGGRLAQAVMPTRCRSASSILSIRPRDRVAPDSDSASPTASC